MSFSTNEFAVGILGMSRSGLLLNAAKGNEARLQQALAARSKAMALFLRGGEHLATFATKNGMQSEEEALAQLDDFRAYDTEFKRTLALSQTPIWRVTLGTNPKVNEIRRLCGLGQWVSVLVAGFLAPQWPTALEVLSAKSQDEIVAAYVLAQLFDTNDRLSAFNSKASLLDPIERKTLVWQAFGEAETKAELERATKSITLSASENGIAIVKLFGHEFLLPSGERNLMKSEQSTRWFTLAEIQANFRSSSVFRELMGEQ